MKRKYKDMHANSFEKKVNIDQLEKEDGLNKFLPNYILRWAFAVWKASYFVCNLSFLFNMLFI